MPGYGKLYVKAGTLLREFKNTLGPEGLIETKWLHGGPQMENLTAALAGVVAGDLKCLAAVLAANHHALSDAAAELPRLVISRSSLASVLEDWRKGFFSAQHVQAWSSFVRRGYVSGRAVGATLALEIEYDAQDEALIVDVIGRLDEMGDQIDGHIDAFELQKMLRVLRQ